MIKLVRPFLLCVVFCCQYPAANGQLWKRIKNNVKAKVENRAVDKSGDASDAALNKTENVLKNTVNGNNTGNNTKDETAGNNPSPENTASPVNADIGDYKNYDFVPGDKIIFQPDLSIEPDAELPARFAVLNGNAEIQSFDSGKILHLQKDGNATVAPLMNSENYLPEQFTLEFDMMYENEGSYFRYASDFNVAFRKAGDKNYYSGALFAFKVDGVSKVKLGPEGGSGAQSIPDGLLKSFGMGNTWHHIAIYVRKNIGKAYIDQYRVFATNTLPAGAEKFTIKADRYGIKIKNLRLAAGGNDKYSKIITDGKFITHGILFDAGRSVIKPESMGALNEIAKLMKDLRQPEL